METTRSEALRLALLACLSFTLGWVLVGCGDVTATMVSQGSDAGATTGGVDAGNYQGAPDNALASDVSGGRPDQGTAGGDTTSSTPPAPPVGPDAGAGELGAPEATPPRPHCQGAAADYRVTVCKPACGTCGKLGEASTYIAGCWTTDDFHCVDSCGDCR